MASKRQDGKAAVAALIPLLDPNVGAAKAGNAKGQGLGNGSEGRVAKT